MTALEIVLLGIAVVLFVLVLVAAKFPRGRADWRLSARQTAWALASGIVAAVLFLLLYWVTRDTLWPDAVATVAWVGLAGFAALALAALFLPSGLRIRP